MAQGGQGLHKVAGALAALLVVVKIVSWLVRATHPTPAYPTFPPDPPAKPLSAEAQRQKAEQDRKFADFMKSIRELEANQR
jgi:hypothetical protein